ncbi:MAG: hypothetical protein ACKOYM_09810 [Actinomycetes bacterium]
MTALVPKGDPFDRSLEDELATARVDAAAADRRSERWSVHRRAAEQTIVDVLAGSAGAVAVLGTFDGHEHRGIVGAIGADAVELTTGAAQLVVAFDHVVLVRLEGAPGRVAPRGDWTMADALADLVATERATRITSVGGHATVGDVISAGLTVALRTPTGVTHIATEQVISVAA